MQETGSYLVHLEVLSRSSGAQSEPPGEALQAEGKNAQEKSYQSDSWEYCAGYRKSQSSWQEADAFQEIEANLSQQVDGVDCGEIIAESAVDSESSQKLAAKEGSKRS